MITGTKMTYMICNVYGWKETCTFLTREEKDSVSQRLGIVLPKKNRFESWTRFIVALIQIPRGATSSLAPSIRLPNPGYFFDPATISSRHPDRHEQWSVPASSSPAGYIYEQRRRRRHLDCCCCCSCWGSVRLLSSLQLAFVIGRLDGQLGWPQKNILPPSVWFPLPSKLSDAQSEYFEAWNI